MGFKDPAARRSYYRRRYRQRRDEALEILGNRCATCGAAVDDLHVDHVDPAEKTMKFPAMANASRERFLNEVARCQLLCPPCHSDKSTIDGTRSGPRGERSHTAKLTAAEAGEIRGRASAGETHRALSAAYGVHRTTVGRIVSGRYWQ